MIKDKIVKFCSISPCAIMLAGILTGIIPLLLGVNFYLSVTIFLLFSALILFSASIKSIYSYTLWTAAGILAFYASSPYLNNSDTTDYLKFELPISLSFYATDNSLSSTEDRTLTSPRSIFIQSSSFTALSSDKEQLFSQKIYMHIPFNSTELFFGKSYKAEGELIPADKIYSGYFLNYLKSMGAFYVFSPETIAPSHEKVPIQIEILTFLIKARDSILNKCLDGIRSKEVRGFLAGVLFGLRHGIEPNLKKQFIQTGTIHIIVISGAHIAILALLLFIILTPLPIRMRYAALPLCLLIYIILIGYPQSAMRAFVMITVFMLLKSALRVSDKFNTLFFTASVMLLFNPYSLCNPGFIYSFVVVFFLLAGWNCSKSIQTASSEIYLWRPKKHSGYSVKKTKILKEKIILLATSSIIAAAAALPLQIIFNNILTPIVPFISILLLPLLFPLFIAAIIKIIFWPLIHGLIIFDLLNGIINGIINLIFYIIETGTDANLSFYVQSPSLLLLIAFYSLFISALIFFHRKQVAFSLISILIMLSLFIGKAGIFSSVKAISVTPPGSSSSAYIFTFPATSSAIIINCPENSAYEIDALLKENGINHISNLILTQSTKERSGDTIKLMGIYSGRIDKVETLGTLRNSKTFKDIYKFAENTGVKCTVKDIDKKNLSTSFYMNGKLISIRNHADEILMTINLKEYRLNAFSDISSSLRLAYMNPEKILPSN